MHVRWESEDVSNSLLPPEEVRSKYSELKEYGASVVVTKDMTPEERVAFYREKTEALHESMDEE